MQKIKLQVTGNTVEVTQCPGVITSGTVGLPVEFTFDSQWDGLSKTVVFRADEKVIAVAEPDAQTAVPWEVLEKPNVWLRIGVYGANEDGSVVIPTLWVNVAVIHTGTDPQGDPALEHTLPVWQEMQTNLARHNADAENPHCVTFTQTGAAPAGFGLGENGGKSFDDFNSKQLKTGFYQAVTTVAAGAANGPLDSVARFQYGTMLAEGRSGWLIHQKATYKEYVARRYTPDGCKTWSEWEYENPPMLVGKEYRTTERWNGQPVYTKLIDCGGVVDSKYVEFDADAQVIRFGAVVVRVASDGTEFIITMLPHTEFHVHVDNSLHQIFIYNQLYYDGYKFYVQIWYLK